MEQQPKTTDTPAKADTPEVKPSTPEEVKPKANSDLDAIIAELKRFGGRMTKLEQRTKGGIKPKISKSEPRFSFEYPEENEAEEEEKIRQERELVKVERGITRLIRDSKYSQVFEKDKTLARILENNPLALLENEPLDAEDALDQIANILDETFASLQPKPTSEENSPAPEPTPANPSAPTTEPPKTEKPPAVKSQDEMAKSLLNRFLGR